MLYIEEENTQESFSLWQNHKTHLNQWKSQLKNVTVTFFSSDKICSWSNVVFCSILPRDFSPLSRRTDNYYVVTFSKCSSL